MRVNGRILPLIGLAIFLGIYLFRVTETVDFPNWDETYYMRRGQIIADGNPAAAGISNVNTSPMMPVMYAAIYTFVRGPNLYPYAIIISTCLLALGCYLLTVRFLNPYLALGLTIVVVVSALPEKVSAINYYTGTGLLWLGLSLFSKRPLSRGIGLLIVALSIYLRPEFIFVFMVLAVAMIVYEVKRIRAVPKLLVITIAAYLPAVIFMGWTLLLMFFAPPNSDGRTANAIPWSYDNYLLGYGQETDQNMGGDAYIWFERDLGKLSVRTISAELAGLLHNPLQSFRFITFDILWIFEIYAKSFLTGWTWNNTYSWPSPPTWSLAIVFWIVISGLLVISFRIRRPILPRLPTIALMSLSALVPWLILVNPDQRAFMTFPLLVIPVGYALTILAEKARMPTRAGLALLAIMLFFTPRPFDTTPQTTIKAQYATIKQSGTPCRVQGLGDTFVNIAVLDGYICPD